MLTKGPPVLLCHWKLVTAGLPSVATVNEVFPFSQISSLKALLFKEDSLRNDILVFVDRTDAITMKLLDMPLEDGQQLTILPLAHGG